MKKPAPITDNSARRAAILRKALINAADAYRLSRKTVSDILGMSEASLSRLYSGNKLLDPKSKEGELALLFLRLYRSLNALLGDNEEQACLWLNAYNHYFNATPLETIHTIPGLVEVINYLDAMRGKV